MINRRYCLLFPTLFLLANFPAPLFADNSQNNEQIAAQCKPYLSNNATNGIPAAANAAMQACYNTPNICNTKTLSGVTNCAYKLNAWEFNKPIVTPSPAPQIQIAQPLQQPSPQTTAAPPVALPPKPATTPYDYYAPKQNTQATPPTGQPAPSQQAPKNDSKETTGINWF